MYIGNNEVIETTYRWDDGVQITGVRNLGDHRTKSRTWTSWGKIPYVDYTDVAPIPTPDPPTETEDSTPLLDDVYHPDMFPAMLPIPKEYIYQSKFKPLGALSMYRCTTDEFINGKPPLTDGSGFPIPDGSICEVLQLRQYCDIYRMAFGEWWKYGNDTRQQTWIDFPISTYSIEEYPVQIIVTNWYDQNIKLLCLKDQLYISEAFLDERFSLSGVLTNSLDGRIAQLKNGTWQYDHAYNAPSYTVTKVWATNQPVFSFQDKSVVSFPITGVL